jgi:hypothetical protein
MLLSFIFMFGPLIEFILRLPQRVGTTAVNLAIFGGLLFFDWYLILLLDSWYLLDKKVLIFLP